MSRISFCGRGGEPPAGARRDVGAVPGIHRALSSDAAAEGFFGRGLVKFDGYRTQAHLRNGWHSICTRRGHDWTLRFRPIVDALSTLPAKDLIVDGEAVVVASHANSGFELLHADLAGGRKNRCSTTPFDLLYTFTVTATL